MQKFALPALSVWLLTACTGMMNNLEGVNQLPELRPVANPQVQPNYQPLTWPMPSPAPEAPKYANSLWRPGARSFFRDQRAQRAGDILRVRVEIDDRAQVNNQTRADRSNEENVAVPNLLGSLRGKIVPGERGNDLIGLETTSVSLGRGQIQRLDRIITQVSALVTQVLPNGNMVIDGSQEILINNELRELAIAGVVRPEDIDSDNSIDASRIAEARITYGGRGHLSNVQGRRYGYQVIDAVSPF